MRLVERQTSLKAQYHFECKCYICMDPRKDNLLFQIIEGLVCLSCNNEICATLADLDNCNTVHCDLCSERFKTSEYKRRLNTADKTYNKGKNNTNCICISKWQRL